MLLYPVNGQNLNGKHSGANPQLRFEDCLLNLF